MESNNDHNHNRRKRGRSSTLNDITNTHDQPKEPASKKFKSSKLSTLNKEAIISSDSNISFYIVHTHKFKKSKRKIKTNVHITGTKFAKGNITVYYQFPSNNQLKIKQKKPNKITANWLRGQRADISTQILHKLFQVPNEEMNGVEKPYILTRIYSELGYLKAQQELINKKSYKFDVEELKIIKQQLAQIKIKFDIDYLLFIQFLSREDYVKKDSFIRLLEDLICNPKFPAFVTQLWDLFGDMLHDNPSPGKFETAYQNFRECSIPQWYKNLSPQQFNAIKAMEKTIDPDTLKEFEFEFDLIKSLLLSNIKKLFLKQLKIICFKMYSADNVTETGNVDLTEYQHSCFGGSTICTLLRIYYASHVSEELSFIMVTLIRRLICKTEEYHKVSKILKLENRGGMYIMTPRLLPFNKQVLNDLWTKLNQLYKNTTQLPDYESLIISYQNNVDLFISFSLLYDKMEYQQNKLYVKKVFKLYVEFICTKVIWQSIKQLHLHKDDMALRDKFKYRHLEYLKQRKSMY